MPATMHPYVCTCILCEFVANLHRRHVECDSCGAPCLSCRSWSARRECPVSYCRPVVTPSSDSSFLSRRRSPSDPTSCRARRWHRSDRPSPAWPHSSLWRARPSTCRECKGSLCCRRSTSLRWVVAVGSSFMCFQFVVYWPLI